jgi:hypothetical protein
MKLPIAFVIFAIAVLPHGAGRQEERVLPTASEYLTLRTKATAKKKQLRIPEWTKIAEARLETTDGGERRLIVVFREFAKHPLDDHLSVDIILSSATEPSIPNAAVLLQVSGTPHETALSGRLHSGSAALWSKQTGLRFARFQVDGATVHLALPEEFKESGFYSVSSMWYPSPQAGWVKPQEFAACASAWKRETGELRGVAWSFGALASRAIRQLSKPPSGEILPNSH